MKIPLLIEEGKARMNELDQIVSDAIARFAATGEAAELERVKAGYLGRAGTLTEMLKGLGKLPPEARREAGALINAAKDRIEAALTARREAIALAALMAPNTHMRHIASTRYQGRLAAVGPVTGARIARQP